MNQLSIPKQLSVLLASIFFFYSSAIDAKQHYGNLNVHTVNRIHDGDTFNVNISDLHPLIGEGISVRIKGIDTPEITDQRQHIKHLAIQARDYLQERLKNAKKIELIEVQRDKYFRILAEVLVDEVNIGEELISLNFAKPYNGKTKPVW